MLVIQKKKKKINQKIKLLKRNNRKIIQLLNLQSFPGIIKVHFRKPI